MIASTLVKYQLQNDKKCVNGLRKTSKQNSKKQKYWRELQSQYDNGLQHLHGNVG